MPKRMLFKEHTFTTLSFNPALFVSLPNKMLYKGQDVILKKTEINNLSDCSYFICFKTCYLYDFIS